MPAGQRVCSVTGKGKAAIAEAAIDFDGTAVGGEQSGDTLETGGTRLKFADGESRLSEWMRQNAFVVLDIDHEP